MTVWLYSTGITLSAGESLQVDYDVRVSKRLRTGDGTVYPAGSSVFPDSPMSCRITASA
jgi:hypothetical protein